MVFWVDQVDCQGARCVFFQKNGPLNSPFDEPHGGGHAFGTTFEGATRTRFTIENWTKLVPKRASKDAFTTTFEGVTRTRFAKGRASKLVPKSASQAAFAGMSAKQEYHW